MDHPIGRNRFWVVRLGGLWPKWADRVTVADRVVRRSTVDPRHAQETCRPVRTSTIAASSRPTQARCPRWSRCRRAAGVGRVLSRRSDLLARPAFVRYERPGIIRSRLWRPSDGPTADPALVLAHLLEGLTPLKRKPDDRMPISIVDRFELGYEHYLRNGGKPPDCRFGRVTPSELLARQLDLRRGDGESPTESYLETRTIQRVRTFG